MSTTTLPPLPFKADALAPHLSEQTLNFHHKKHHQTYVDNLHKLAVGTLKMQNWKKLSRNRTGLSTTTPPKFGTTLSISTNLRQKQHQQQEF